MADPQITIAVQLGPVTTELVAAIEQHTAELDHRRALLASWSARRREGVRRSEVRRGIAQLKGEIAGLHRALDIAVDVEGWTAR